MLFKIIHNANNLKSACEWKSVEYMISNIPNNNKKKEAHNKKTNTRRNKMLRNNEKAKINPKCMPTE